MDSQEDPRKSTFVPEKGDSDSKYQAEFSSSNHGLQTEDSVMNLYEEIPRPVLEHKLDCLLEEDEDVDCPTPRIITGLPEPITIDDHTENSKPNNPVISSLKAPCLLFTTEEIRNYIDYLETKLNVLNQKMLKINREQTDEKNRIDNQQQILDEQEEELIFHRKFFKTGKNYANEPIYEEYKRPKTPPEAEFCKYSFGRKLAIEMHPKDVDPDIKKDVDGRIQDILNKTQAKATQKDFISESPRSPSPSLNSFQNIIYINHEFDNFYDDLEFDDIFTPTKSNSPIYEVPLQFKEREAIVPDHVESVSIPTYSSIENSALTEPDTYEVPIQFQDVHTIRELTTDMKPTLENITTDQLLQPSTSSQNPYQFINIQEYGTGIKYDSTTSPSPNLEILTNINELKIIKECEFKQNRKEVEFEENKSTVQLEINQQNNQNESQLNDLLEIAKNLSTSQDEQFQQNDDVPMTQEEQNLIEQLEKYVGIYDVNLESLTDVNTESPMFGKVPYIDIGSVQPKLEISKPTELIVPSSEKDFKKSARNTQDGNEKKRRPVTSTYKRNRQQPTLPPIESKKIFQPIVSDFNTRILLPDILTAGSATKSSFHREADTTLLHSNTIIAEHSQMTRHLALPQIRTGYSRKPYYQDVDVSSLPKKKHKQQQVKYTNQLPNKRKRNSSPKNKSNIISTNNIKTKF